MKSEATLNMAMMAVPVTIGVLASALVNHPTFFGWMSLILMTGGAGLLFAARWPLYRQRRFFSWGCGGLDRLHRRLYHAAYVLLWSGAFFALTVLAAKSWHPG